MNFASILQPDNSASKHFFTSFSTGSKFFVLLFMAIFMSIPAFFVDSLADGRAQTHHAITTYDDKGIVHPPAAVLGIRLADSYRGVTRSLKYITLFLGLVFLTYFIFEVRSGHRVHIAQYALVGVGQTAFYLLLLSFAEHLGFDLSFLIAGAATVLLFSFNAEWLFGSRQHSKQAFIIFGLLYAFIYVLLRLDNYALMIGALVSFGAVAATMYLTRNVDWYEGRTAPAGATPNATSRHSFLD
ncbi:MAG: inner membrane CreD family protein [Acidobacteriaceae bacterium]|nr:inner membrane CreD family protein [Acidobacteriaceae bacterium]